VIGGRDWRMVRGVKRKTGAPGSGGIDDLHCICDGGAGTSAGSFRGCNAVGPGARCGGKAGVELLLSGRDAGSPGRAVLSRAKSDNHGRFKIDVPVEKDPRRGNSLLAMVRLIEGQRPRGSAGASHTRGGRGRRGSGRMGAHHQGQDGERVENPPRFRILLQELNTAPYRGKMIRLMAAVRIDAAGPLDRAQLWLRVDRAGGQPGFFDNMDSRPIRGKTWGDYEIVGDVAKDAELIVLGLIVSWTARISSLKNP
jgi:hypothetical protein